MTYYTGCYNSPHRCDVSDTSQHAWSVRCEPCNTYIVACSRPHNWSPIAPKRPYAERQAEYFARLKEELKEDQQNAKK